MTILALIKRHWLDVLSIASGVLAGMLLLPAIVSSSHWVQDLYDATHPPADMKLVRYEQVDTQTLRLTFSITRNRDCLFINLEGYTGIPENGFLYPASHLQREDGFAPQSYPAGITVQSPPWLLRPLWGKRVVIYARYDCDGHFLRVKVIDEALQICKVPCGSY